MDAVELLLGDAPFIADTSAWWRFSSLPGELAGLVRQAMGDDRLWITPIVRMEILYSARSTSEYTAVETELDGFRILRNDRAVADTATSLLRDALASSRACVSPRSDNMPAFGEGQVGCLIRRAPPAFPEADALRRRPPCASPCGFTPAAALRPLSATVPRGFEDFASAGRGLAQRARFAVGEVHLYEGKDRAR